MQYENSSDAAPAADPFEALDALFARGRFGELLQQLPPLFEAAAQLPAESPLRREQLTRLLFLRASCQSKYDHFREALQDCAALLDLQPLLERSRQRAQLMELISYCHVNLSMPEPALRAAHVTFQDGLRLNDPLLCSQGLERAAMAYWCMSDALEAERFMIESLGFVEQQGSRYERLRRYSNTVHLLCALHDHYETQGQARMAQGVLERGTRFLPLGQALAGAEPSDFIRLIWLANVGRWQRRLGDLDGARRQLTTVLDQAPAQQWHGLRRSILLELSVLDERSGQEQRALARLEALFEPPEVRVRDVEALGAFAARQRLYERLGMRAQAELAARGLQERRQERLQRARQAQRQLQGLGQRIVDALAQADHQRVERELERLRILRDQGLLNGRNQSWADDWVSERDLQPQ